MCDTIMINVLLREAQCLCLLAFNWLDKCRLIKLYLLCKETFHTFGADLIIYNVQTSHHHCIVYNYTQTFIVYLIVLQNYDIHELRNQ